MLNVRCPGSALHEAIQTAARGVTGRSTRPVQNDIYLEAKGDTLRLVATDTDVISMEVLLPVEVLGEGSVTAPPRVLVELTGSLPAADATLIADESQALQVECGGSRYIIRGRSAADFQMLPPIVPTVEFSLPQSQMHAIVRQTVFATSRDETRPILTGALFQFSNDLLRVVATDTYRLAMRTAAVPVQVAGEEVAAIVPARALGELVRVASADSAEPVTVAVSSSQIEFTVGPIKIGSRLIEGQFPNFMKVIPDTHQRRVKVRSADLEASVRRALIVARDDSNRVVFSIAENELRLRAESPDVGRVDEQVAAELEGEPLEIAFNGRYLVDVLEALETEFVFLDLGGPLNPGMVRPENDENYLYVLMPMQIMQ